MRPIDADALIERFKNEDANGINLALDRYALKCINDAPTIDMAKVGQWEERYIEDDECPWTRRRFYCSACGGWITYGRTRFCPKCGAKMEVKK